ncbi:LytTR family DNA-binding domain-containing protein [Flavobacterium sp.]|uniref:LytR/AlgR family response regulator transcription factor n=1 Tax=Flavobacterium sp. TaxID=239 RepID=UPI001208CB69|nr:LytTR family DNA-binding domain-containing protein [Flavobacterium sp.]RZJ70594.1 MAG: response regulator transcription factor [Flavobacterium sp.]
MKKINCLIIDDEPLAVQLLEAHAGKVPSLNILFAGSDVFKAIEVIKSNEVDLIFVDIQMPEITGLELMKLFDNKHNFVITSAYMEYAVEAFQYHVVDYLVKPISFNRFFQAVEKFARWQETFRASNAVDHLMVKADRKHYKIAFADILYIEGLKDYIRIHTKDEKIMALENMKDILEKLPSDKFMRVHRSFIIPTDKVKMLDGNRIQMQNHEFIPIGETYRKPVSSWFEQK